MSIKVINISKKYGTHQAVNEVSFEVKKGEIVGFLGPNGAGKSTVMKILTHYIQDFEGKVLVDDMDVTLHPLAVQQKIGYLPEHNPLYSEMYVREYLDFQASVYQVSKKRIEQVIEEVALISHAHKKINELSKGYKQRVGLAAAILHQPEVLILDEPTTGLDPNQLSEIRTLIRNLGKDITVLFSTHIMQEVEAVADRVIILNQGKIVADENLVQLQSQNIQTIEVEFDTEIKKEFLHKIADLKSYQHLSNNLWLLQFDTNKDMRAEIFDFAQNNGLKILNLTRKNKSLEQLFQELTNEGLSKY